MKFELMEVRGIVDACLALKMTRRSYTPEYEEKIRTALYKCTDSRTGKIMEKCDEHSFELIYNEMNKIAKWGAGVGLSAYVDAGHETILRFIDFSIHVTGLHRGAMDDFDAHAMRMNNRIVRSSTRGNGAYSVGEMSDWYKDKIIPLSRVVQSVSEIMESFGLPQTIERDGKTYVFVGDGYIQEDFVENGDAQRGLYRLSIPMNCICKINLFDLRHIYMRRNEFTHANPELAAGIEMLADQIEDAVPGDLGKLIRYDYCSDGQLHHIMDIQKVYVPREDKKSSIEDPNANRFG